MKKPVQIFSAVLITALLASCGGGSGLNSGAFCDGDILIPFQEEQDDDWGLININGEVIIEPEFDFEPSFAVNGTFKFKDANKDGETFYRYAKIQDGKAVESDDKWDMAGEFKEGLAPVRNKNEKVQFINENYEKVFVVDAEKVSYFNEGFAAVCDDAGKYGFINSSGEEVIKKQYDFVDGFHDGYATVGKNTDDGKEFMIIDKSGNVKLDLGDKYDKVGVYSGGLIRVKDDDELGFIDLEGNKVVEMNDEWSRVTPFLNGYASFQEDNEWGLINTEGKTIFKANYQFPMLVFNEKIWVKDDDEWGVIDMEGDDIIEPEFDGNAMPYPFVCATTVVQDGDDYFFIDAEGKEINQEEYGTIAEFNWKYVTGKPWNGFMESDYFDIGKVRERIAGDLLKIKTAQQFKSSFELPDSILWNTYNLKYREVNGMYQFYYNSNSFDFTAYKYIDESNEDNEQKSESKYPLSAPKGIRSIDYTFSFDDHLGITDVMSIDAAREFQDREDKNLHFNEKAKVNRIRVSISLNGKASDKAALIAESIANGWKSSMENADENKEGDSYSLKGDLDNGEIDISARGSSVQITIRYFEDKEQ